MVFPLADSLDGKRTPLGDGLPWITYAAIDWFSHYLTREMTIFEWGSGGSTAFFSHRVKQVFTIEHSPEWYKEVVSVITKNVYSNVNINLVPPEKSENTDAWYTSTDMNFQGFSFEKYIRAIDIYPNGFFDIVFVDGRSPPRLYKAGSAKNKTRRIFGFG